MNHLKGKVGNQMSSWEMLYPMGQKSLWAGERNKPGPARAVGILRLVNLCILIVTFAFWPQRLCRQLNNPHFSLFYKKGFRDQSAHNLKSPSVQGHPAESCYLAHLVSYPRTTVLFLKVENSVN